MATWYTPEQAQVSDLWPDGSTLEIDTVELLLDIARDQVLAYAPALPPFTPTEEITDEPIPARYRLAQLRQAANIYRAAVVDAGGQIGDADSFSASPRPLDWHVKNLLRPQRGRPRVG